MKRVFGSLTIGALIAVLGMSSAQAQNATIRLRVDRPHLDSKQSSWFDGNMAGKAESLVEENLGMEVQKCLQEAKATGIEVLVDDAAASRNAARNREMETSGDYNRADVYVPTTGGRATYNFYYRSTGAVEAGKGPAVGGAVTYKRVEVGGQKTTNFGFFSLNGSLVCQQRQSLTRSLPEREVTVKDGKLDWGINPAGLARLFAVNGIRLNFQGADDKKESAPRRAAKMCMKLVAADIANQLIEFRKELEGTLENAQPQLTTTFAGNRWTLNVRGDSRILRAIASNAKTIDVPVLVPGQRSHDVSGWIVKNQSTDDKLVIVLKEMDGNGNLAAAPLAAEADVDRNILSQRLLSQAKIVLGDD